MCIPAIKFLLNASTYTPWVKSIFQESIQHQSEDTKRIPALGWHQLQMSCWDLIFSLWGRLTCASDFQDWFIWRQTHVLLKLMWILTCCKPVKLLSILLHVDQRACFCTDSTRAMCALTLCTQVWLSTPSGYRTLSWKSVELNSFQSLSPLLNQMLSASGPTPLCLAVSNLCCHHSPALNSWAQTRGQHMAGTTPAGNLHAATRFLELKPFKNIEVCRLGLLARTSKSPLRLLVYQYKYNLKGLKLRNVYIIWKDCFLLKTHLTRILFTVFVIHPHIKQRINL